MFGHFIWGGRSPIRRWKDLNPGAAPSPRTGHAKAAETIVASDLQRPIKQRLVDLLLCPPPFGKVERNPTVYGDNPFPLKGKGNAAS
jgi:hypothetical protein